MRKSSEKRKILIPFLCQSAGHMEVLIQVWHFSIQKSCYKVKITELWNIGHTDDLDIFWGQTVGHTEVIT